MRQVGADGELGRLVPWQREVLQPQVWQIEDRDLSRRRCRQREAIGYGWVYAMWGDARDDFGRRILLQSCSGVSTQTQYLEPKDLPCVESAEVVCHQRKRKAGPVDVFRRAHIRGQVQLFDLFLWYDLLKKPAPPTLSTPCFEGRPQDCHCSLGEETVLQRVPIFFAAWASSVMELFFQLLFWATEWVF